MLQRDGINWLLAAIIISLLLHAGVALWWSSRPVQLAQQPGVHTVTVDLIAVAPSEPVAQTAVPAPAVAQPEPELPPADEMALQHKVVKKPVERKPPPRRPAPAVDHPPATEQQAMPAAQPAVDSQPPASVTAARYDADYLNNPAPVYPSLSRRLGEEGRVVLRVQVSADGRPLQVELKKSSGFERLDNAARKAAEKWRFVPARQGGIAVSSWVEVPLQFSLQK